jgi:hypothetical protein
MKVLGPGIFSPATITMLSGMLTLLAATLALGSLAQDQSGQSVAMLSQSFRWEIGADENGFELIAIDRIHLPNPEVAPSSGPGALVLSFGESKVRFDPAKEFATLLSELERIAGNCVVATPAREVQINVADARPETVALLIENVSRTLQDVEALSNPLPMQIEIQTWAASPTETAWVNAIRDASQFRDDVDRRLSVAGSRQYRTTSSASLWPHAARARPAMTIVFRSP